MDTAEAMLKSGRYLYVLFTCQQAIEKVLKAIVIAKTKKFPPRIHNLVKLADIAGIVLDKEQSLFLEKLSYYYLETRYPDDIVKIGKQIKKNLAKQYFDKTGDIIKWLRQELK